tara:strand:- start:1953 stop:2273 length:321 start_codon:yes stop_codon:yes gene_type:complete
MGNVSSRAQNNPYKALTKEEKEALAAKKAAKDKTKSTFVPNDKLPKNASKMEQAAYQAKIDDAKAAKAAAEQAAKEAAAEQAAKEAEVTAKSGVLTGLSKTEKGAN